MRHILTFLFVICSVFIISAQSAQTAFITDAEIKWLDKEVNDLNQAYANLKISVAAEDNTAIAKNKSSIIKSVNRLATNCKSTYDKIDLELHPNTARDAGLDNPPNYVYNQKKKVDGLEELNITAKNFNSLRENSEKLINLKETLKSTKYAFEPIKSVSKTNLDAVSEILAIAKITNSIITSSIVEQ